VVWSLLKVGLGCIYSASWGLVRLEKQQSRKKHRSRTVEKQRSKEAGKKAEKPKSKKQRSRTVEKQGNRNQKKTLPKRNTLFLPNTIALHLQDPN
jgi:hypothetical protein